MISPTNAFSVGEFIMSTAIGGAAVQKMLGPAESMMVELGCVAAVSDTCNIAAEERTGVIREPPYPLGFVVKIAGKCFHNISSRCLQVVSKPLNCRILSGVLIAASIAVLL